MSNKTLGKVCLIYQPCGGGDILFLLKAADYYYKKGYQIVWPVVHEYACFIDYLPWIDFISWGDVEKKLTHADRLPDHIQFPYKEAYDPYAPCIFSDNFIYINGFLPPVGQIMPFKYTSAKVSPENWQDFVYWNRHTVRENELFSQLGLIDNDDYVFINKNYQLRPYVRRHESISSDPSFYGKKVIEMSIIPGYSIFDWVKVIERASSIHMIETSLCYLMEGPQLRNNITKDINLYSRKGHFGEVDFLFKLPWKYTTH